MFLKTNLKKVVGCAIAILAFVPQSFGQLLGVDAYMIGDHVEIGINGNGGHEGAAQLIASHNRSNLSISSPVYFGFVANPQLDSWAQYDGDFFSPGTPENGFGMEISGVNYGNNATGGPLNQISGGLIGYEEDGDCITTEWEGTAAGVRINVKYHLLTTNLFYTTEVTMTNESGADLTDVYYYRNVDPDNNVTIGGGYGTINTIVAQPDGGCQKALVSAEQNRPLGAGPGISYVGFGALGSNFRVTRGGFSNRNASDMWNGTGGLTGTVGSALFADQAISIAYKSDIAATESINFTFATVLSEDALEAAFEGLYYVNFESFGLSGGGVVSACSPEVDTAKTCGGNPVTLSVEGPNVEDFDWVWTPGDDLTETVGVETVATPVVTTTYTVTGTPLDACFVLPIVKVIVVEYLEGPQIEVTYPDDPICGGTFDLTTLDFTDVNGIVGTVTYFFSEEPTEATQTDPQWPSDFMVEGDLVYLMIADTVNGCYDYVLVDIDFADPANAGSDAAVAYCPGTEESLNLNDLISVDADAGGVLAELTPTGAFDELLGTLDLSGLAPGTYDYSYTVGADPCPSDEAIYTVTIYPTMDIVITSVDANCDESNGSATAAVSGAAPYTYSWSNGSTSESAGDIGAGTYTVTVTDANGCESSADVEIIETGPLVTSDTTYAGTCDGKKCLTETLVIWDCDNPNCVDVIATCKDLSNVVLVTADGTHEKFDGLSDMTGTFCASNGDDIVTVYVKSGCFKSGDGPGYGYKHENPLDCDCAEDMEPGMIQITPDSYENEKLLIYPNPSNGQFSIEFLNMDSDELVLVEVYNLRGVLLLKEYVSSDSKMMLNYADLNGDVYIIKASTSSQTMIERVIVR